ncbi:MAG: pyrroline-5-carboxylate reductase [Magnetococcales bacterium]|nr:pyrroline-5-carboxylate reductase [Magnetococcales bacterium]MBF0584407.1 pyrroline-5-carboxylate reductase [Magnetococcales bacterium]
MMLQNKTIAFIGGGNMAVAMIQGLLAAGCAPTRIRVAEPDAGQRQRLTERFPIVVLAENALALAGADAVVIAVKPGKVDGVLRLLAPVLGPEMLILSIAAGISLAQLQQALPAGQPLVRVMPNTPALIGAGISALLPIPTLSQEKRHLAQEIMAVAGDVVEIEEESWMDAITALSGSGPAYLFLIAEALSDGGVACGLPRGLADRLAVKTLIGSARLIDETGQHPAVLKNQVTSPGGTTIAGLEQLESAGVRAALMAAVRAAWSRSRALSG